MARLAPFGRGTVMVLLLAGAVSACSSTPPRPAAPTVATDATSDRVVGRDPFAGVFRTTTTAAPATAPAAPATAPGEGAASPSQLLFGGDPAVVFRTLLPQAFAEPLTGLTDSFTTAAGEEWGVTQMHPQTDRLMVMIERRTDPAAASAGSGDLIGGGLWRVVDGHWALVSFRRDLRTMEGLPGNPFDPELEPLALGEHLAAVYQTGRRYQGDYDADFIVVADVGDRIDEVLVVRDVAGANATVCASTPPCFAYTSSLTVGVAADGAWPDLTVTTTGTRLGPDGAVAPVATTRRFAWTGARYEAR